MDGIEFGGGERVFLQLVSRLAHAYQIHIAATPGGIFEHQVRSRNIKFFPVNMRRKISLRAIYDIRKVIVSNKIALIHSQGARADFFARMAGRITGVRHLLCTVATLVEGFHVSYPRRLLYRFLDRITESYVDRFIVVSDTLRKILVEDRGISAHKVIRIFNGIELSEFNPANVINNLRHKWGVSADTPIVGAIGRMVWEKGFENLLCAAPEIIKAVPNTMFLIVGEGPLRNKLEHLAGTLDIKNHVKFTGFQSNIKELLFMLDVLAAPSVLEGFPMVILEAMAMEKPIVATYIDGITEQITDGEHGMLVSPQDSGALAKAIIRVLNDKNIANKMGTAARKKVEREFSVGKMVSETESIYRSLLTNN